MERRRYLRTLAVAGGLSGVAGCLGSGHPNTALGEPDRQYESEDVSYPAWGEQVPAATLTAPIANQKIAVQNADTPTLLTFFFSHCKTVCPVLISTLRSVQTHALNNDYTDDVTFLPMTFDPARDDAERLNAYADQMNIALDAAWQFLRPESKQQAKTVIEEKFGVAFQRQPAENGDGYMFVHTPLIVLANADGYVERAYNTKSPKADDIIADLETVR